MKILFILLTLMTSSFLSAGTESGGGGGVIWIDSHPVLLDYFHVLKLGDKSPYLQVSKVDGKLPESPFSFDESNVQDIKKINPAFKLALETLDKWQALPLDTISVMVRGAFEAPLLWNFTHKELTAPVFFRPPMILPNDPISVAAYYSMKKDQRSFIVNVYLPIWNKMNLLSQSGLLIHETLRQVQIGIANNFSEEALQQATVIYMMCKPKARLNYYLSFVLTNGPEAAKRIYGDFNQILAKSCDQVKR
jgi:hypothetical protein